MKVTAEQLTGQVEDVVANQFGRSVSDLIMTDGNRAIVIVRCAIMSVIARLVLFDVATSRTIVNRLWHLEAAMRSHEDQVQSARPVINVFTGDFLSGLLCASETAAEQYTQQCFGENRKHFGRIRLR